MSTMTPVIFSIWYCKKCITGLIIAYNHKRFTMTSSNGNIFRVTGHLCGEFTGHWWIPSQRPVTRSFDVFCDLSLNKRLSKQSWGWWFETLSRPFWRHRNVLNTLRLRQNRHHFADIFKCILVNENVWISINISLKFAPKCQIDNIPALVQIMLWRRPGNEPLTEPMTFSLLTHICVIRSQWVNTYM